MEVKARSVVNPPRLPFRHAGDYVAVDVGDGIVVVISVLTAHSLVSLVMLDARSGDQVNTFTSYALAWSDTYPKASPRNPATNGLRDVICWVVHLRLRLAGLSLGPLTRITPGKKYMARRHLIFSSLALARSSV